MGEMWNVSVLAVLVCVLASACGTSPEPLDGSTVQTPVDTGIEDARESTDTVNDTESPDSAGVEQPDAGDAEASDAPEAGGPGDAGVEPDTVEVVPNACGGARELLAEPGSPCGPCGDDVFECGPGGESVFCSGETRNRCGGCGTIERAPGEPCDSCAGHGVTACTPDRSAVVCVTEQTNACGGCTVLTVEPGGPCGTCGQDVYVCDPGGDSVSCSGDAKNACGGCSLLSEEPGTPCGPCGDDAYECTSPDAVACSGTTTNACGGCAELGGSPGAKCGECGIAELVCAGDGESLECPGDATNACGGCTELAVPPGRTCGRCGWNEYICDVDGESTYCGGDTANRCGGCGELTAYPGTECSGCGAEACVWKCDGGNDTVCVERVPPPVGFIRVSAGRYVRGVFPADSRAPGWELRRQHPVTLTRDFFLQEAPVTRGQWMTLMGTDPSYFAHGLCNAECPIHQVNFWDALSYANALSRSEGLPECYTLTNCTGVGEGCDPRAFSCRSGTCEAFGVNAPGGNPYLCEGYRLPMDAEWEYAARAGDPRETYNGDIPGDDCTGVVADPVVAPIAWYCRNSGDRVQPVRQKRANAWGFHDMLGNVSEWVWGTSSWYRVEATDEWVSFSASGTSVNPTTRGGSYRRRSELLHVGHRSGYGADTRYASVGFRLARTAP